MEEIEFKRRLSAMYPGLHTFLNRMERSNPTQEHVKRCIEITKNTIFSLERYKNTSLISQRYSKKFITDQGVFVEEFKYNQLLPMLLGFDINDPRFISTFYRTKISFSDTLFDIERRREELEEKIKLIPIYEIPIFRREIQSPKEPGFQNTFYKTHVNSFSSFYSIFGQDPFNLAENDDDDMGGNDGN